MRGRPPQHALGQQLLRHGHGVAVLGELVRGEDVLEDVVTEVKVRTRLPLRGVLEEISQIVPVTLKTVIVILLFMGEIMIFT